MLSPTETRRAARRDLVQEAGGPSSLLQLWRAFAATDESDRAQAGTSETWQERPPTAFQQVEGRSSRLWRIQDSNLGSFRDGFTVRSHWPLGQSALPAAAANRSGAARITVRPERCANG